MYAKHSITPTYIMMQNIKMITILIYEMSCVKCANARCDITKHPLVMACTGQIRGIVQAKGIF